MPEPQHRRKTHNKLVRFLPDELEALHEAAVRLGMSDTQLLRLLAKRALTLTVEFVPVAQQLEQAESDRDAARDAYAAAVRSYEELGQQRCAAIEAERAVREGE